MRYVSYNMMYYRISKNEKILFFGKKIRPGVGSDLNSIFANYLKRKFFFKKMFIVTDLVSLRSLELIENNMSSQACSLSLCLNVTLHMLF